MLISRVDTNIVLSKRAAIFYLTLLTITVSLWVVVISGYIFLQIYIYPIEKILIFIAEWTLTLFKTYLLFRLSSDLPRLELATADQ